tara:strand:+ start:427 stop:801 length:375 start_codon:yes stop_codon:yes gene_type:complete
MNIIYIGFVLSVLLLGLIIAKKTKNYFSNTVNSVIIQMYIYGIMVNICILGYILIVFRNIELKQGPKGPNGELGPQGFEGDPGECKKCDESNSTIGFKQNNKRKAEEIFIETPILASKLEGHRV